MSFDKMSAPISFSRCPIDTWNESAILCMSTEMNGLHTARDERYEVTHLNYEMVL